jgi:hypothetical protein
LPVPVLPPLEGAPPPGAPDAPPEGAPPAGAPLAPPKPEPPEPIETSLPASLSSGKIPSPSSLEAQAMNALTDNGANKRKNTERTVSLLEVGEPKLPKENSASGLGDEGKRSGPWGLG